MLKCERVAPYDTNVGSGVYYWAIGSKIIASPNSKLGIDGLPLERSKQTTSDVLLESLLRLKMSHCLREE